MFFPTSHSQTPIWECPIFCETQFHLILSLPNRSLARRGMLKTALLFFFLICGFYLPASAQDTTEIKSGKNKGLVITAGDSSYSIKLNMALQPRITASANLSDNDFVQGKVLIRRARLIFSGFAVSTDLEYFFQLGLSNQDMESSGDPANDYPGIIFDALIKWTFAPGTRLWFGQGKLPGAKTRLFSYQGLNFLERSTAENKFNVYRDAGLWLHNTLNIGDAVLNTSAAITGGEGKNRFTAGGGYCYTGRIEYLPLGSFKSGGDNYLPDLTRESSLKLAAGAAYSFNDDAVRTRGTLGSSLYSHRDIETAMGDILIKYGGLSIFAEYYKRLCSNPLTFSIENPENKRYVYKGQGYSAEASYMITPKINFALRCSFTEPHNDIEELTPYIEDYSLGFTRFFNQNHVKLQADITYTTEKFARHGSQSEFLAFGINMILQI